MNINDNKFQEKRDYDYDIFTQTQDFFERNMKNKV